MASQTPNRLWTAEPFVTLSLPKKCTSKLSPTGTPSITTTGVKAINLSSRKKNSASGHDWQIDHETAVMSTPSKRRQKQPLPAAAMSSPTQSSIIILKYRKTPLTHTNGLINETDRAAPPETPVADHADYLWMDGQTERRSSVASSTDNGTRSSGRVRKLTTKAQALAGTSFLPSLQKTPDVESRASPAPTLEASSEQVMNHIPDSVQASPINNKLVTVKTDEAPIESVESSTIRSSTRERKPTVRAIEMESERAQRKRPASPMTTDRASKVPKRSPLSTSKPSKLRLSTADAENDTVVEGNMAVPEARDDAVVEKVVEANEAHAEALPKSTEVSATFDQNAELPQVLSPSSNLDVQHDTLEVEKALTPPALCELSCLSPSSRLLAFARIAADWSDSDEDSGDENSEGEFDVDLGLVDNDKGENSALLAKVCETQCRCDPMKVSTKPSNGMNSNVGQDQIPSREVAVCTINGGELNRGDGHRVTATKRTQKPMSEKLDTGMVRTKTLSTKNEEIGHRRMALKRQNSSFEQRMKEDYLASQQKKADESQRVGPKNVASKPPPGVLSASTIASSPSRSVRTRASALSFESLPPREDVNHNHKDYRANTHTSNSGQPQRATATNPESDGHADIIEALITHQKKTLPPSSSNSTKPKGEKIKEVSGKKPGSTALRGGGKTSAGGSIRLTLRDSTEPEKVKMIKQQQTSIPPQARSIKLKFTTAAR